MITKHDAVAYQELFAKAEKVLREHGQETTIQHIDDYFTVIGTLAQLEIENPDIDPIFTILPATEEFFQIDANTREIKVPENFSRYGVAVQGDDIAEIIYFSIDRYFDAVDLAEKEILIQWKYEKDKSDAGFLSATYKRSLTLANGKIVFGWPISGDITEHAGNVLFSVRFYDRDEDDKSLIYSFSTSTAVLKIQPGLNFRIDGDNLQKLDTKQFDRVYKNLRNSQFQSETNYAKPEFSMYYIGVGDEYLTPSPEKTNDLPITFVAKAHFPQENVANGEVISSDPLDYSWYKLIDNKDYNKNNENINGSLVNSKVIYMQVDTSNLNNYDPLEFYYTLTKDAEGKDIYEIYSERGTGNPFDDNVDLYVRYTSCTPSEAGYYYALARNMKTAAISKNAKSDLWTVPFPKEPTYNYLPENKRIFLDSDPTITIQATADDRELIYNWYFGVENNFEASSKREDYIGDTIIADNEGYYFLQAVNTRNGVNSKGHSEGVLATYHAATPVIAAYYIGDTIDTGAYGHNADRSEMRIALAPLEEKHDYYSWAWYHTESVNVTPNLVPVATTETYTPTNKGYYYCVITNHYNDDTAQVTSKFIYVV